MAGLIEDSISRSPDRVAIGVADGGMRRFEHHGEGDQHTERRYSLTEREHEIAVCLINSKWHAAYSTNFHAKRLEQLGVPAGIVDAPVGGLPASFTDEREQVVYAPPGAPLRKKSRPR